MKKQSLAILLFTSISIAAVASQVTFTKTPSETPVADFTKSTTEIVDTKTGLVWQPCLVGQTFENGKCTGTPKKVTTWEQALELAANQQNGWRLPTIKELSSIVDNNASAPAFNGEVFTFGNDLTYTDNPALWSSTPKPKGGSAIYYAYALDLYHGQVKLARRANGKDYSQLQMQAQYVLLVKNH